MSNTIDITRPSYLGIPHCINETVSITNDLAQCVGTDARWLSAVRRSMTGEVAGECYKTDTALPETVNMIKHGQLMQAKLTAEEVSADRVGRAVTQYRYRLQAASWRMLFPNLDFLLCPILQGITDADLDNGKNIENIAGTHPVTLTTSSRYLYPDKRLVHIDNNGWITYNVEGVEKYGRIWRGYPYNMLGCQDYPSNGHYCVSVIYEDDIHTIYNGTNASGVEIADNRSGNAYKNYTFKRTETNVRQIGVNAIGTQWNVGNNQSGICVMIFNADIDSGAPAKTYVYQRNLTIGRTFIDTVRTDAAIGTVPTTRSTFFRCISNNQGRVKWFGIMRGTQDTRTIEVLKHYLCSFASQN